MNWRCGIAAALLLCAGVGHADPVSFADLAKHLEYTDVKISPNGDYLAAEGVVKGQRMLALIHLSDKKGQVVLPREGNDVVQFWWASPTRVVYTVGEHVGGYDSPFATGELFAVDADGGRPKLLYGYRGGAPETGHLTQQGATSTYGTARFIAPIPAEPNFALVSTSSWAGAGREGSLPVANRMDLRNGQLSKIVGAPGRDMRFVADHQGHIRFAYGDDSNGNAKVFMRPIDGDGWQEMPEPEASRSYPITFNRDDSLAYFACASKTGGFGICTWDSKTKAWNTVWSNPKVESNGLLYGTTDGEITGVSFEDGRPAAALFNNDPEFAKVFTSLMQQFPGEDVRFISATRDGQLSVLKVSADRDPGTFFLYDSKARKLTPLMSVAKWIDPNQMAGKQPFEFAARDGLDLQGYVSYPPGHETAKHLPMVVFVHGGPYGVKDDWDYDSDVQAMATRGYAVLQVNFRGSGGRGYGFEKAGWREWGGKMQDDVTDATHWAIAQGIADPARICIFGASYGGYAALEGAVKEPDLYKCAIGYVGVYDLRLMYDRGDVPQSTAGENYLKRVLGEDRDLLAQRSPVNQLDHLKARVMLIVGGEDKRVPPVQGITLHMALAKRNIAHGWLEKPGESHGFYDEANVTEMYTRLLQFIGSSIGPGVTSTGSASTSAAR